MYFKKFEDLTFADHYIFEKVLQNAEICQESRRDRPQQHVLGSMLQGAMPHYHYLYLPEKSSIWDFA